MVDYIDSGHREIQCVEANSTRQRSALCVAVGVVTLSNPGHEGWLSSVGASTGGCCVAWEQRRVLWVLAVGKRTAKLWFNVQPD